MYIIVRDYIIVFYINQYHYLISRGERKLNFSEVGDLFTCGDREYGKLGHDLWSLGKVDTTEKIVQVACGANHTVALNGKYNYVSYSSIIAVLYIFTCYHHRIKYTHLLYVHGALIIIIMNKQSYYNNIRHTYL